MQLEDLVEALRRSTATGKFSGSDELQDVFEGHGWPGIAGDDATARLAAFARAEMAALLELVRGNDAAARHMAIFALAHTGHSRAAETLMAVLVDQKDHFDHGWAYQGICELGEVAFDHLLDRALHGNEDEAMQAVQALGQCRGRDVWPLLERVHRLRRPLPDGFFMACYNAQDARAVPVTMEALDDPEQLEDAICAASSLLALPGAFGGVSDERRAQWADRVAALVGHEDCDVWAFAVEALGALADARYLPVLEDLAHSDDADASRYAVEAIGRYRSDAARALLTQWFREEPAPLRLNAAGQLIQDEGVAETTRDAAWKAVLEGTITEPVADEELGYELVMLLRDAPHAWQRVSALRQSLTDDAARRRAAGLLTEIERRHSPS